MAVQQFCLRWNNHQPNFISVFTNLLSSESLVDVTLAAEGKQLHAHKVVLSACSTYFQALFTSNPCQHPIVILKDIKYNDLKTMVDFMYYGEVNVSQDQLPAILKTAETLKVKGLAEMPEQLSLSKSISQSSDKGDSPSPISPSVLRRKRLRKSSTGSGSEQTSEETAASGSGSTDIVPTSPIKHEPEETPLRHEASTESETREGSHSFEEESSYSVANNFLDHDYFETGCRTSDGERKINDIKRRINPSEESSDKNVRWNPSEESRPASSSQPPPQGWPYGQMGLPQAADWPMYPRRKRSTNPQQDENFIAALEAVRTGGLGFCKAAKIYGVNNRTLWLEYKKRVVEPSATPSMGSKRGRLLMRQHRVKKDSDVCHPEGESDSPRIERQSSEPTPNLLTVPQQNYLVKQNSNPTPPTQSDSHPKIRIADEFRRTLSIPQCSNEPCEAARACHCPALRPGPALGCNFCWNTIDGHGRILRRKTKYHCPECQTNLCIVPCFQEYHEKQSKSGTNNSTKDKEPLNSGSLPTIMKTSSL